jgi:hypothetical protein
MRRRGGTCVGSARVVDGHGEKIRRPTHRFNAAPRCTTRAPEEACRDTPSVDREKGWVGSGCVVSPWYVWARSCVVYGAVHRTRTPQTLKNR